MTIPMSNAANAYATAAQLIDQGAQGKGVGLSTKEPTEDFANLVTDALTNMVESGRDAEQKAAQVVQGNGNIVDVVTAVAETEVALETVVAVRDRVISAYEEIMRMPI